MDRIMIRKAAAEDLDAIAALEAMSFPPAEAASKESFRERMAVYISHFQLLTIDGKIISLIDGPVTRGKDLVDEMYEDTSCSDEAGEWQMIFGVVTHPDYRCRGYAGRLMRSFIEEARREGRKGLVLTCKEDKIHFYASLGYVDEGLSCSVHGGVPWHQMRLTF